MPREQDLLAAFVEFADTFVDDYDVVEFLHRLATRVSNSSTLPRRASCSPTRTAALHYVASSSERMRLIELFELQHDEGPCLDAYRTGVAVHSAMSDAAAAARGRGSHPTPETSASSRCPRYRCDSAPR